MTVQNGRCRDGGWEDAAGQRMGGRDGTADGRTRRDSHRTSVILDITKREVKGTHGRGGTVEWMVAGRCHGGIN